jgi:hypothetical protein
MVILSEAKNPVNLRPFTLYRITKKQLFTALLGAQALGLKWGLGVGAREKLRRFILRFFAK